MREGGLKEEGFGGGEGEGEGKVSCQKEAHLLESVRVIKLHVD